MAEPSLGEKGATEDHWGQKGDKPQATCGYSTELLLISQYGNGAWQKKVSVLGKASAEEFRDASSAAYFWMAWQKTACVGMYVGGEVKRMG